jgi:hypothetical protein
MTEWSKALADAMQRHLQIAGSGGSSGSAGEKAKLRKELPRSRPGTTGSRLVVPVVPERRSGTTGTRTRDEVVPGPAPAKAPEILEFARSGTTGTTGTTESEVSCADEDAFEERAALVENGAGVPREWAEGFARLCLHPPAPGFSPRRWQQLIEDGGRFLDRWGSEAAGLGWTALDVFGVHARAPAVRYDAAGLVPLISGGEIVAIMADRATIRGWGGGLLTYLRRPRSGAVALWELVET